MKIELMIYIYIAICVSMIAFNIVYIFILRSKESHLASGSEYFEKEISLQLDNIKHNQKVDEKYLEELQKKLKRTASLTAFDKAMDKLYQKDNKDIKKYIEEIMPVFSRLAKKYKNRDSVIAAYFPYVIGKYRLIDNENLNMMYELLRSKNVYCRENALSALYSFADSDVAICALKIIDKNISFHHPKLVCDGLMEYKGERNELAEKLLSEFSDFSVDMQLNILNFIRFSGLRFDDEMLVILKNERENQELRFSAIRYFEKHYNEDAKTILQDFAQGIKGLTWQYQAISSSAIKTYPDKRTEEILKENLSSTNWYVRLNSAKSCETLGLTYRELIDIFDGDDRYAREILRYRLDRRQAEEMAVTK